MYAPSSRAALVAFLLIEMVITRTVFAQGAAIEVTPPGTAPAGSTVTVKWSGPNGSGDFITVVREGSQAIAYLDYKQTSNGRAPVNPVSLVLPAEPGAYEIRYVSGNPRRVLAAAPYDVTAVVASIEGPASVTADSRFEVVWSGPNNGGDWVTIVEAGAAPRAYGSYLDARSGRPDSKTGRTVATLRAPAKPGRYELRYVQQGTRVIGTRAIEVASATSIRASTTAPLPVGSAAPQTPPPGAAGRLPPASATAALSKTPPPAPAAPAMTVGPAIVPGAPAVPTQENPPPSSSSPGAQTPAPSAPAGTQNLRPAFTGRDTAVFSADNPCPSPPLAVQTWGISPGGVHFTFPGQVDFTRPNDGYLLGLAHTVTRRDLGATVLFQGTERRFKHAAALDSRITYVYEIREYGWNYQTQTLMGACRGMTEISITAPRAQAPMVSVRTSSRRADFSFAPVGQDETGIAIIGEGFPPEGFFASCLAACGTYVDMLPPGDKVWLFAPYWDTNDGRVVDWSTATRVTATIP